MKIEKIKNTFKHVGSGKNVNLFTLIRNALPYYISERGYAFTPLTIFLSVNSICNLHCKMCDVGQKNIKSSFYKNLRPESDEIKLTAQRLTDLIKEAGNFNPKPRISVTTTEPLLYKGIFEVAQLASENGMEFQMTTNGLLLDRYFDEIFASGIHELAISIDGKGKLHDEIRGADGLYNRIKNSLSVIGQMKKNANLEFPKISIVTTVSNFNYNHLTEFVEDVDEGLYDRLIVSHMNFIDKGMAEEHNRDFPFVGIADIAGLPGETDNFKVDADVLYKQIKYIKSNYSKAYFSPDYDLKDLKVFYNEPSRVVWDNRCYIPWFVMEILANGDVIPLTRCIYLKMGNVYENSLAEIWNGPKFMEFRKHLKKHKRFPVCKRCRGLL